MEHDEARHEGHNDFLRCRFLAVTRNERSEPLVAVVVLRSVVASGHDERKGCHKERNDFLRWRFLAVTRNEKSETLRGRCGS